MVSRLACEISHYRRRTNIERCANRLRPSLIAPIQNPIVDRPIGRGNEWTTKIRFNFKMKPEFTVQIQLPHWNETLRPQIHLFSQATFNHLLTSPTPRNFNWFYAAFNSTVTFKIDVHQPKPQRILIFCFDILKCASSPQQPAEEEEGKKTAIRIWLETRIKILWNVAAAQWRSYNNNEIMKIQDEIVACIHDPFEDYFIFLHRIKRTQTFRKSIGYYWYSDDLFMEDALPYESLPS